MILTDGRGKGKGQIVCYNFETAAPVFGSREIDLSFEGLDPTDYYGLQFKLLDCKFLKQGMYLVRFLIDGAPIQEVPVTVR